MAIKWFGLSSESPYCELHIVFMICSWLSSARQSWIEMDLQMHGADGAASHKEWRARARARECTLHARNNIYFIVFAFLGSVCRIGPTDIEQTITPAMNADGGNSTLVATAANILENTCDDVNERMVPTFSMESRIWLQLQWATGWRRWSRKGIGEYGEKS